jgi:hypothetical protein
MVKQNEDKYITLIKEVFSTDAGRELIKQLIIKKQRGRMFSADPLLMAFKAGQFDLIEEFKRGLLCDIDELQELQAIKTYNPFNKGDL